MEVMTDDRELYSIIKELKLLDAHIKTYDEGAYPAFYLQIKTAFRLQDILELKLKDVYYIKEGSICVKDNIHCSDNTFHLTDEDKMAFAVYILHRTPIFVGIGKQDLLEDSLCVNKQGKPLTNQVYRKMLDRTVYELDLKQGFNIFYLHSLYGYFSIAFGKKTVPALMQEYHCTKYYLFNQIFKAFRYIGYNSNVVMMAAGLKKIEGED